jgi:hypothetical protein
MRMKLVEPLPAFQAVCLACGKKMQSQAEVIYADLDGSAYRAYYCGPDAVTLTQGFSVNMDEPA